MADHPHDPVREHLGTHPEIGTGFRTGMTVTEVRDFAVVTANPHASRAATEILRRGGSAADAAVTALFTLGLCEPQSSGIGGGGYLLHYDARSHRVTAIDGRETAPRAADRHYLTRISARNHHPPYPDLRRSGRSIGVPGIVAALALLHGDHGRLPWAQLLHPARELALQGFRISERLAASIAVAAGELAHDPAAAAHFLNPDGSARAAGTRLSNPDYAETLRILAEQGPAAFYTGEIAADILERATRKVKGVTPSLLSSTDLADYTALRTEPLSARYRDRLLYTVPPSSSGGVVVLETLGILDNFALSGLPPIIDIPQAPAVHLIAEAERLAYADRDAYLGDPAYSRVPGGGVDTLISAAYTRTRSTLIDAARSMGTAVPGLGAAPHITPTPDSGTTHVCIIDAAGNGVSMSASIESAFGSYQYTRGFLLNNQLTDFDADSGEATPNRVAGAKRPRSSMAPVLVFREDALDLVLGSPGGTLIPQYVVKALVNLIDWGLDPQQAVAAPNIGALNQPRTTIGAEHPGITGDAGVRARLRGGLEALGHEVSFEEHTSGLGVLRTRPGARILGGADPRREGLVLGGP